MFRLHHNNINLLRAVAVLAVFAHHFEHYAHWPIPYLGSFGGKLGVQLFFLISGYLIVQSAARQPWWAFLVNRMFRIFPAYWVAVLAVSYFISHVVPLANASDWPYFLANLLTLSHIVPYALGHFDVLTVSWTLTIEWLWYLLAPLLLWGAHLSGRRGMPALHYWGIASAISLIISIGWIVLAQQGHFDSWYANGIASLGVSPVSESMRTAFIVVAAPAQLVFFMLGVMLWIARAPLARVPSWVCLAAALAMLVQPAWWPQLLGFDPSLPTGLGLAAFFLLVNRVALAWTRGALGKAGQWVGDLSYPIYLLHVPAIVVATVHLGFAGAPALFVSIGITLASAMLLHHGAETPGRKLGARLLRPHPCKTL